MAGERIETPIAEICHVKQGRYLPPGEMAQFLSPSATIPVYGANGILGYTDKAMFNEPVSLVTCRGNGCGLLQRTQGRAWISNNAMACPPKGKNDSRYLHYLLFASDFSDVTTGSAQPQITAGHLNAKRLLLATDPFEQKAIAAVLGALDDKIELNRRMNATLEAMARALFQSWFVDFDPVRAKAEGRPPAGLDEPTAALFPAQFQASELGEIPQGWTAMPLPEAIEVNPRRSLSKGAVAPYLDMKNLPTQGHSADEVVIREFSSGTKFRNGDTLLARITPCLENGKTGYVNFLEDGQVGWGSTEYIILAPKPPLPPQFGYLLARSDALRSHAIQNMTGTSGRQRVPFECFDKFLLAVPTPDVARRFDEITAPVMAKIKANSQESRTLATLRDTLLPKLLSGKLTSLRATRERQPNDCV